MDYYDYKERVRGIIKGIVFGDIPELSEEQVESLTDMLTLTGDEGAVKDAARGFMPNASSIPYVESKEPDFRELINRSSELICGNLFGISLSGACPDCGEELEKRDGGFACSRCSLILVLCKVSDIESLVRGLKDRVVDLARLLDSYADKLRGVK